MVFCLQRQKKYRKLRYFIVTAVKYPKLQYFVVTKYRQKKRLQSAVIYCTQVQIQYEKLRFTTRNENYKEKTVRFYGSFLIN